MAGLIPGSGRSPGKGNGNPPQDSCLENSKDRGAWQATLHRVSKSWTQLKWLSMHLCTKLVVPSVGSMIHVGLPVKTPFFPQLPQITHQWNCEMYQFSSVAQSCPALCDPMDCSTPGFPVHHQLLELAQTHVHWVGDAIQPYHPLSSPSPPAFNLSQHQDLFQWVSSLHQVTKVLEFQLQHQSFQWIFRTDFL